MNIFKRKPEVIHPSAFLLESLSIIGLMREGKVTKFIRAGTLEDISIICSDVDHVMYVRRCTELFNKSEHRAWIKEIEQQEIELSQKYKD